jgi:hypothetical protein
LVGLVGVENSIMRVVIKPIETIYKGYRFRSRLEARWAVFFDHLRIPYEYEREGYQTEFGWYPPDFYIFPHGETPYGYIVEVKPDIPTDTEKLKLASLVFELPSYTEALLLISAHPTSIRRCFITVPSQLTERRAHGGGNNMC